MKEIMIDDVDVSGCKYYKEELNVHNGTISTCTNCGFCTHNISKLNNTNCYAKVFPRCCDEKDCYYKQLKRKEIECEEFKQALQEIKEKLEFYKKVACGDNCSKCKNPCHYGEILNIINEVEEWKK